MIGAVLGQSSSPAHALPESKLRLNRSSLRAEKVSLPEDERSAFESELFGSPPQKALDGEAPAKGRPETSVLSSETSTSSSSLVDKLQASLDEAGESIQIGGSLYLRLEYQALSAGAPETFALVSPSNLDLYLDARPLDGLRTYVRTRLRYDPTVDDNEGPDVQRLLDPTQLLDVSALLTGARERVSFVLDQLWVKFDVKKRVFLSVGQQRVRWGTGRVWNPTDFLNAQRFDPLALFDPRLGVGLVKIHLPLEDEGANFYLIALYEGANSLDRIGIASRAEVAFSQTELATSLSWRRGEPLRFGLDCSTGLGDFELRVELAALYDVGAPFFEGNWSIGAPLDFSALDVVYRDNELIPQAVAGLDYTFDYGDNDQLIIGLEYFWNDAGYSNSDLYPLLLLAPSLGQLEALGVVEIGFRGPPPALFQPLYLGRQYLAAFVFLPSPWGLNKQSLNLTAILNISDRSLIARIDHTVSLMRFLNLRSYINVHAGRRGEFKFGLEVPGVPGVLDNGLTISPPLFELGVALNATL